MGPEISLKSRWHDSSRRTEERILTIIRRGTVQMEDIRNRMVAFHHDDSGQDLIEYALIAALIALSAVVGMGSVAKALNDIFSSVGAKINAYIV